MKASNLLLWFSWSILSTASPLEERATGSLTCNNAQVKALRSSNGNCFCSSYLQIPISTVTKYTTHKSTIHTTVTKKQVTTKVSTTRIKSTAATRTVTANPQTGLTTLTKTVTVTPRAFALQKRKHVKHPREIVERAAKSSTCATPAVVKNMKKAAISSACGCLSIAPKKVTITKTKVQRITRVSTKVVASTARRTSTIKSKVTAVSTFKRTTRVTRTKLITVTASTQFSSKPRSTISSLSGDKGTAKSTKATPSKSVTSASAVRSSISKSSRFPTSSSVSSTRLSTSTYSSRSSSVPVSRSSKLSASSSSVTSSKKPTSSTMSKSSSKTSSSKKTTTSSSSMASTTTYPPTGPLYTPNKNACAVRSTRSSSISSTATSYSALSSNTAKISQSTTSRSFAQHSFASNRTINASSSTSASSTTSLSSITSRNTTRSANHETPPFYLQSACDSNTMISGLYAALIPTQDNPTLQFVTDTSSATQFRLSASGHLYVLPSNASSTSFTSFSSARLIANVDAGAESMDLFFNDEEFVAGALAEKVKCEVDGQGLLQCTSGAADELLWNDVEGTVAMADCVLDGCSEAELVVIYV